MDGNLCTIIIGGLQVICVVLSLFIVDSFGRRPLLIVSGIIITLSTCAMGVSFYIFEQLNNKEWGYVEITFF